MRVEILRKADLDMISSASAMEIIDGMTYIAGDDSSSLYCLDPYLNLKAKVNLYEAKQGEENRIPKKDKADLEAMTPVKINGYPHLIIFGSGSVSPQRDKAFLVKLPTSYNKKFLVWERDLSDFYSFLRINEQIVENGTLNIEGAATGPDFLVLFNRKNKNAPNAALYFYLEEFIEFIQGHMEGIPFPLVITEDLPEIEGIAAGYTGATIFEDKLFFTSAVEDAENAYDDGKVAGSLIGWKNVRSFERLRGMKSIPFENSGGIARIKENGKDYLGKVESVSVFEKIGEGKYTALAVTDNDTGASEILLLDIEL